MADRIITVTDPSVVTNDTLSGYNNYSDIDGQLGTTMTPTEATNGKTVTLSDGSVHEVTTKPVGATNGEFSAVVSNAVTVNLAAGGWSLTGASYDSVSKDVSGISATVRALAFSSDGTKMYVIDDVEDDIYQYTLSTPWDMASAGSPVGTPFSNSMVSTSIFFKPDGTKVYISSGTNGKILEYPLLTPWDATSVQSVTHETAAMTSYSPPIVGLWFTPDGLSMFFTDASSIIKKHLLSVAWDLSTLNVTANQTYDASAQEAAHQGIWISTDGLKMFTVGTATADSVNEYTLTTPYDISSGVSFVQSLDVSSQDLSMRGTHFKPDGLKMYLLGTTGTETVYQYSLT